MFGRTRVVILAILRKRSAETFDIVIEVQFIGYSTFGVNYGIQVFSHGRVYLVNVIRVYRIFTQFFLLPIITFELFRVRVHVTCLITLYEFGRVSVYHNYIHADRPANKRTHA